MTDLLQITGHVQDYWEGGLNLGFVGPNDVEICADKYGKEGSVLLSDCRFQ